MDKYVNFGNVTSMTMSGRNCKVNGKTINVPKGASVSVVNGKVYVDGKEYKEDGMDKLEVVHLTISSDGVIGTVESDVDIVVNGDVRGSIEAGVNVTVQGDVEGDVEAGVNANIQGSQRGRVDAGVNVNIGKKIYE